MPESVHNPEGTGQIQETRNANGTFKEGVSGNPAGRPLGARNYSTLYRDALKKLAKKNNTTPETIEEEITANAITRARTGDYRFYKDHLDREHGKATQRIIGDVNIVDRQKVDDPIISKIAEDINELYRRTGGEQGANSGGDGTEASAMGSKA